MKFKYIPLILWVLCILLATITYNFQSLLFSREIGFNIRMFPELSDLFITHDIHLDSKSYVFQKIGHAISFGILFLLLARCIQNNRRAVILCLLFALFTEFIQLFFERSGRLVDVLIDAGGIYLAYRLRVYVMGEEGLRSIFLKLLKKIEDVFTDEKSN